MRQGRAPGNRARPFLRLRLGGGATAGWTAWRLSCGGGGRLRDEGGGRRAGPRYGRLCAIPSPPEGLAGRDGFNAPCCPAPVIVRSEFRDVFQRLETVSFYAR